MSHVTVSGANLPTPNPPGAKPVIPPRLNIVDLIKDDKQWSLYIQALTLFQTEDPAKPLSWFAVSGIHGYPYDLQWENAGPKTEDYGYCVHGLPHFPTWHRPYLALYEQALQAAAIKAAQEYKTDADSWMQAALTLRAPYWDWADPATYLPPRQVYDNVQFKNLRITAPDGPKDVPNPLLAYTFQRRIRWPYSRYPATIRHPRSDPAESIEAFEDDVGSNARSGDLQFDCWRTLNWTTTWLQFSNQGATRGQRANSLETLHNWMHNRTGGGGHMSDPISAGFDPIFMLHHTNVDRQLALWQTLHPEVWISQQREPRYANRDLSPFWKDGTSFHRSTDDSVRDLLKFQSTYPEFVGLENLSTAERKAQIQAKVDALYDPNNRRRGIAVRPAAALASASAVSTSETQAAPQAVLKAASAPQAAFSTTRSLPAAHADAAPAPAPAPPSEPNNALQALDWFTRIRVKKFQLKQSFTILIFLGSVPSDVSQWRSSPHLVGSHSEFVNSDPEHCVSCSDNAGLITEGFVQLDDALERRGLAGKGEEEVEKFIHDEIQWRIQKVDGTVVEPEELEVLEIAVMTWDVSDGDVEVRPVHRNVTSHKAGGRVPGHKTYHL